MTYVITEPCINVKDKACVDVCPVDCIYEGADQLFISPDECIDCGACEPECPVDAIFEADFVPDQWKAFIDKNAEFFSSKAAGSDKPAARKA
jgi:NAD-dependent dihydropyrimidine dehydrogenase PreA subunit